MVEGVADMQRKTGDYAGCLGFASTKLTKEPHKWNDSWSNGHLKRVAMAMQSKGIGAGEPQRN